ncbi:hypothetical protein AWRI1631_31420 [Saccharomyces cerevisiae AWRI1631]|uniref:Uncharacterized protein n=1 Tax=Saccharomyces cerevisiae (strain AWRI1631) TaxID=545124 RepID=B5VF27_YEAS6|nr:hypothetical protein AWRI1631_31420 [Saccharomyces cerevisiae AWRI1631]
MWRSSVQIRLEAFLSRYSVTPRLPPRSRPSSSEK